MRRAAKTDSNHQSVLDALRKSGITAFSTHAVGKGFPDIVCAFRGVTVMLEVKDGSLPPSGRALTADERDFHASWAAEIPVVGTPEQAVEAVVNEAKRLRALP